MAKRTGMKRILGETSGMKLSEALFLASTNYECLIGDWYDSISNLGCLLTNVLFVAGLDDEKEGVVHILPNSDRGGWVREAINREWPWVCEYEYFVPLLKWIVQVFDEERSPMDERVGRIIARVSELEKQMMMNNAVNAEIQAAVWAKGAK